MTNKAFDENFNEVFGKCQSILANKANEYATEDRLHNFKRAAALANNTPQEALLGMMLKHIVSICDYVERSADGEEFVMLQWDEKIIDTINYCILLRAVIIDENK